MVSRAFCGLMDRGSAETEQHTAITHAHKRTHTMLQCHRPQQNVSDGLKVATKDTENRWLPTNVEAEETSAARAGGSDSQELLIPAVKKIKK